MQYVRQCGLWDINTVVLRKYEKYLLLFLVLPYANSYNTFKYVKSKIRNEMAMKN